MELFRPVHLHLRHPELTLEEYRSGAALTPDHRRIITSPHELWQIGLIANIPDFHQKRIGLAMTMLQFKHYNEFQLGWVHREKYFLGQRLGHEPTELELADDFMRTSIPQQYRLAYLLQHPEKVALRDNVRPYESRLVDDFLQLAEFIGGVCYRHQFKRVRLDSAFKDLPEDFII
ncbi:hypothetical protein EXS73_01605 [Candidatus Pacearchaeota archaeon]|nr:hypothetical protein [Candidatus Pacearchaeota archaeon]